MGKKRRENKSEIKKTRKGRRDEHGGGRLRSLGWGGVPFT